MECGKDGLYFDMNNTKINETFRKCKSYLFFVLIYHPGSWKR